MTSSTSGHPPGETPAAAFMAFLKDAGKPGQVDRKTKKLLSIALSIAHRCRPCLIAHLRGASEAGVTEAEVQEVVDLATAFGGCPAWMFYREVRDAMAAKPD